MAIPLLEGQQCPVESVTLPLPRALPKAENSVGNTRVFPLLCCLHLNFRELKKNPNKQTPSTLTGPLFFFFLNLN